MWVGRPPTPAAHASGLSSQSHVARRCVHDLSPLASSAWPDCGRRLAAPRHGAGLPGSPVPAGGSPRPCPPRARVAAERCKCLFAVWSGGWGRWGGALSSPWEKPNASPGPPRSAPACSAPLLLAEHTPASWPSRSAVRPAHGTPAASPAWLPARPALLGALPGPPLGSHPESAPRTLPPPGFTFPGGVSPSRARCALSLCTCLLPAALERASPFGPFCSLLRLRL